MAKKFAKSLFIFRRDIRLEDNTALIKALKESIVVIPCLIIDPNNLDIFKFNNLNTLQFFIESCRELNVYLEKRGSKLFIFKGNIEDVLINLFWDESLDAIYVNREYSPDQIAVERIIEKVCLRKRAEFITCPDQLLHSPTRVLNSSGKPFKTFAEYYKEASRIHVNKPVININKNFTRKDIPSCSIFELDDMLPLYNRKIFIYGGRNRAFNMFDGLGRLMNYASQKDYPILNATTCLSAHIEIGNVSIREVYRAISESLGTASLLTRQLYLRDFHISIGYAFPHSFSGCFNKEFDSLDWSSDMNNFRAWREGETGFPIVDAGMRHLKETGFINNRLRMIVASFLVKDLQIDWTMGEKYFSTKLIDYSQSINNANWQQVASTGYDARSHESVIDPFEEQRSLDGNCIYIKKWIPALQGLPPSVINDFDKDPPPPETDYPAMIVDHKEESEKSIIMIQEIIDEMAEDSGDLEIDQSGDE